MALPTTSNTAQGSDQQPHSPPHIHTVVVPIFLLNIEAELARMREGNKKREEKKNASGKMFTYLLATALHCHFRTPD